MNVLGKILGRFGIGTEVQAAARHPIRVFLLDDDVRRHEWFVRRFAGDYLNIAETAEEAYAILIEDRFDAIFLDHDLLPEHYHSESNDDDERTGFAVARWLAAHPEAQQASTIVVHTRNADGAMRMVEELRRAGRQAEYVPFPLLAQKIKSYWQR